MYDPHAPFSAMPGEEEVLLLPGLPLVNYPGETPEPGLWSFKIETPDASVPDFNAVTIDYVHPGQCTCCWCQQIWLTHLHYTHIPPRSSLLVVQTTYSPLLLTIDSWICATPKHISNLNTNNINLIQQIGRRHLVTNPNEFPLQPYNLLLCTLKSQKFDIVPYKWLVMS